MSLAPRLWIGVARLLGLIDRERMLAAIQSGLRQVVEEPDHPVRQRLAAAVGELAGRLRAGPRLCAPAQAGKRDLAAPPPARRVLGGTAGPRVRAGVSLPGTAGS